MFEFSNYKDYLGAKLEFLSQTERGWKTRLAEHVGCQPSYLSQVLNGKPDLTLEQAIRVNSAFLHDKVEARFFILLVEFARAGSRELREFFGQEIEAIKQDRFKLKNRLIETDELPESVKNRYYSAWFYSAVHIALAISDLQDARRIARRFNLPEDLVQQTVHFLEESGLVEKMKGRYQFTKKRLHLDRSSEFIQRHHINWRSQALQSTEKNLATDLHYSNVFALSKTDFDIVKEIFVKAIADARAVIKPSASEEICAITLDVFGL